MDSDPWKDFEAVEEDEWAGFEQVNAASVPAGSSGVLRGAAAGASGLNRGLADIIGGPVDLVNWGLGKVGVPTSETPFMGSDWLVNRGEDVNAIRPEDPEYPNMEKYGRMTGQGVGMVTTLGAGGAATAGTKTGQALSAMSAPATQSAPAFLAQVPVEAGLSVLSEGGKAAGGSVGEYFGGETGRSIGESAGGLAAVLAPATAVGAVKKGIHKAGARVADDAGQISSAEIGQALDNVGIEKSGGLVGSKPMARAENSISYLPVGGGSVSRKQAKQVSQFEDALTGSTARIRGGAGTGADPSVIGGRIQDTADEGLMGIKSGLNRVESGISSAVKSNGSAAKVDDIINNAAKMKQGTTPAQGRLIDQKIADLRAMKTQPIDATLHINLQRQRVIKQNQLNKIKGSTLDDGMARTRIQTEIKQIEKELSDNLGVDYERLRQWRGEIGARTDTGSGVADANQKTIYADTSDSLRDVTGRAGVEADFTDVTDLEKQLYAKKGSLDEGGDIKELRKLKDQRDGQSAFNYLAEGGKTRPERLELLKRNSDPERWNELSADILDHFGRAKPGKVSANGEFSPDTFLTNWEKMSERSKDLLAGDERQVLDDLATAAKAFRARTAAGNASGTFSTGLSAAVLASGIHAPVTTGATLTAGAAAGAHLASDQFGAFLAAKAPKLAAKLGPRLAGQAGREIGELQ